MNRPTPVIRHDEPEGPDPIETMRSERDMYEACYRRGRQARKDGDRKAPRRKDLDIYLAKAQAYRHALRLLGHR